MLEIMPAHPEAKPELAKGVIGRVAVSSVEQDSLRIATAKNPVEYTANYIIEDELERVVRSLPKEVDGFLQAYTRAREYVVASYFFGAHSWN